jgi:predicted aspartyl protease
VLVDASVEGQKVWVIVDTGSQVTIGNGALRRKLEAKGRLGRLNPIDLLSVTGGRMVAEQGTMRRIKLGGMDLIDMPIAFADVHPFRKLELTDRPAILLGMDALQMFERVSVDFANRKVWMLAPGRSDLKNGSLLAAADRAGPAS